ncbi:hypothetical protein D092_00895 [Rhodococcus ruber Chol-4]|uniref:hypothetical protein n=1 Tax=Rhodococcus TaxID=1827 RepID=UPI00029B223E|nr:MULTISPECIES: hypothetical protein [Rhodococcus]MDO2379901.1 hypothetical protein [Rhodococcus ruber]RIK13221.1 MAG: hypothetical protein DCC47_04000 [Acidobacteriota bacterium]ATQ30965.1 hypothetical protein CS378_20975 [Rhodococcus ruber]AUM16409.1 hypothetical protein CSW53_07640 [Rhodococcus ruber]KXF87676.1 hypothetical protein D092_00895 [Rhodococcus ruber Chol-4]
MVSPVNVRDSFAALTRSDLAVLVPELLLCGQLVDRSGMAHLISAFGRQGMAEVAVEEWQASSPWYTRRMQRALRYEGDGVETIFKGLQLDIGAPPQFMDFRFRVDDHDHGEFRLDHCGALMDVEPLGEAYVTAMCHDIEDPTFDATALATNPHAQVRPIHRPPRRPADRHPHCAWTVTIDPSHVPPETAPHTEAIGLTAAVAVELGPIDPADEGRGDYSGPLLSDLRFADFSHSALVRIAEEVCLQQHLLTLGFLLGVRKRTDEDTALSLARKQLTGIAGLASERLRDALGLPRDVEGLATVLSVHPVFAPRQYVDCEISWEPGRLHLRLGRSGGADADGSWPTLIDGDHLGPLQALVRGVDPHFTARVVSEDAHALTVEVIREAEPASECGEVAITRFSTGATFAFADRGIPLPLTVV